MIGMNAMDAMRRVQAAGYKTGVLTNGHPDVQRAKLDACKFGTVLDDATGNEGGNVGASGSSRPAALSEGEVHAAVPVTASPDSRPSQLP